MNDDNKSFEKLKHNIFTQKQKTSSLLALSKY